MFLTLGVWGVKTPQIAMGVWIFEAAVQKSIDIRLKGDPCE
jgi:hypothetical protein